jgi:glycosyltransferase involved in cell wall biosynthesis
MIEAGVPGCRGVPSAHERVPTVAIGMPVYNGAKSIKLALDSLLCQTFSDFSIVVSDNASTDGTADIVREYAGQDPRINYVRQEINIGAEANFKFVFHATSSRYFMWAAADDTRSPDFLEKNLNFLEDHLDYVGSTLRTRFQGREFDPISMGDSSLDQDDFAARLIAFFRTWHANGRFYSLFRRGALVSWVSADQHFLGSDWSLITYLASIGKMNRIDAGYSELGRDGVSNKTNIFSLYRKDFLGWLLPFYRLTLHTLHLIAPAKMDQRIVIVWRLFVLNLHAFLLQHKVMFERRKLL